ncbi:MAG TPA: tetratricopeptide repeat protein [Terriglobia bacterium]|nr:tetratricopeptide repeat protein [Terriglobia bacterium]
MTGEKKYLIRAIVVGCLCLIPWIVALAQQTSPAEVEKYTAEAKNAMAAKNLPAAATALQKLSKLTPGVAQVHANLGLVLYMQNRYVQAIETFQKAARLDPELPKVKMMLGLCFAEAGRDRDAVKLLEPAFRSSSNDPMRRVVGLDLLRAYRALQAYRHADDISTELLRLYPKDPEVLYNSSRLYGEQSLNLITTLMKVAPDSAWVPLTFAQINEAEKHYDSAITEYRQALKIDPHLPGVHLSLGRTILLSSNTAQSTDAALQEFERELQLDPRNAQAEYEIGKVYRRRDQVSRALQHFTRASEFQPGFEDAQIAVAQVLIDLHRPKEAIPRLLSAIRLNPANEASHFLLATAYGRTGNLAAQGKEMALYRKYHVRPYAAPAESKFQIPPGLLSPEVIPPALSPNAQKQP